MSATSTTEHEVASDSPAFDRSAYRRRMVRLPQRRLQLSRPDSKLVLAYILVAFTTMALGGVAGLLQALNRSGTLENLPLGLEYYQVLTTHGVLLGLAFTTYFILGFLFAGLAVTLGGELHDTTRALGWTGFWLMTIGAACTVVPILMNDASVLFTFYAPLRAAPLFYIGLTLVVVGSWVAGWAMALQYTTWRKQTGLSISPLFSFMAISTILVWQVATLGVALEVLLQLIPWSFGWVSTINVALSRTLFWFFGHPLVYFWLMPAYMAWYLTMPRLIGGRVFSDPLARMSFLMLLMFSIPVGLHHQLMEPGIDQTWKYVQVGLTLLVALPSMMTAFALFGMFERNAKARGYKGALGLFRGLPWRDARFLAMFMGMAAFIPGGAGGIINASHGLDSLVHNTIYITGHFHLTLASTVALTFIGIAYWLVPHASGRILTVRANRLAVIQVWLWTLGMIVMSGAMHWVGLLGSPRRSGWSGLHTSEPIVESWLPYEKAMAVGGSILLVALLLGVGLVFYLAFLAPRGEDEGFLLADPPATQEVPVGILERWRIWLAALAVLIVAAYTAPLVQIFRDAAPGSTWFVTWGDEPTNGIAEKKREAAAKAKKEADALAAAMREAEKASGGEAATKIVKAPAPAKPLLSTTAPAPKVGGPTVETTLGEFYIRPGETSLATEGGALTFALSNEGAMPHEFVILKTDTPGGELPVSGGAAEEEEFVYRVAADLLAPGGDTQYLTIGLEPGKYVLLCNVPGHYELGQWVEFEIT